MRDQRRALAVLYPQERPGTHCTGELGGSHGRSGQVRKISPPPGFDPRTVQPVASRYTDYAMRPAWRQEECLNMLGRKPKERDHMEDLMGE